jgi:hypothetical protein
MIAQLKEICALFGLQVSGAKDNLVDTVIEFLNAPWDTKKSVGKVFRHLEARLMV